MNSSMSNSSSSGESSAVAEAFATTRALLLSFGCLAMALGLIGNAVILWLLRRRCFLGESTRATFRLLAVADLAVILISLSRYLTLLATNWDVRNVADALCRLHIFGVYWSTDVSGWIVCLIATERLLAVVMPTRRFGERLMLGIVGVLALGAVAKNQCLLYMLSLQRGRCNLVASYNFNAFIAADLVLRILLPSLYLLAVNGALLCRYAATRSAGSQSAASKEAKAFRMLFGISVYFFLSMLPSRLLLAYRVVQPNGWTADLETAYSGLILLAYTNNCFALYIYALTSPSLRRLLLRELADNCCCCCCCWCCWCGCCRRCRRPGDRRVAPQTATVEAESTLNADN